MTLSVRLRNKTDSGGVLIKANGGNDQYKTVQANGGDLFLTAAVTRQNESDPDVDLAGSGERVDGIIVSEAWPNKVDLTKDSDSTFDDDDWLRMYEPIAGDELYATVVANQSLTVNQYVKYVDGFLTTSTRANAIGQALEAVTGASTVEVIIAIKWGVN